MKRIELKGKRFSRLVVLGPAGILRKDLYWFCQCDCGTKKKVKGSALRGHKIKSCGCFRKTQNLTHGHARKNSRSKSYRIWAAMVSRCRSKARKDYGGRGIKVCERWLKFENFLQDMGEPPDNRSLDRINNEKGYSKSNCKWSTRREQAGNTRRNRWIKFKGETKYVAEWARLLKINKSTLQYRLDNKWSVKRALTELI